ncbi:hypothetical protein F4779DRAFT_498434 [Xylariaceae sp. FL0662B]|nr:hypothetical protein F4779DRAFT_498434 [Xylariaceae sp. FL0662B]
MRFSTHGSAAVAMAASLANAAPSSLAERTPLGADLDLPKNAGDPISASIDLGVDLSHKTLVAGLLADLAIAPLEGVSAEVAADAQVAVICDECYTKGNINASISLDNVVPSLSLTLKDIKAKLDLGIRIDAGATIAVNLYTPKIPVSLPLPGLGLKADALVALDLVLGVHTAIDLDAGIELEIVEDAKIETDILAGKILDASFSGVAVQVLPIKVRIGCTELLADLRLRVEVGVAAEVDIDDVVPILDLPEIGAGVEAAVFVNLLEYVGLFCATPSCPKSKESYGLNLGVAANVNVEVEDLLSLTLAPTISTALLSVPTQTICEHPSYSASVPAISATTPASGYPTTSPAAVTSAPSGGDVKTTTVQHTETFTVTACAVNVPNCPGNYQTTATLIHKTEYTTVCPATQTAPITAAPPAPTISKPADVTTSVVTKVTLTPCSKESTFTPPAGTPPASQPPSKPTATSETQPAATSTGATGYPTISSRSYPVGEQPPTSYPAESSSVSQPAGGAPAPSSPAGVPSSSASQPAAGAPAPSGPASSSVPAAGYPTGGVPGVSSSQPVPAPSSSPVGVPSASVPAGSSSASYPPQAPSSTAETQPVGQPTSAPAVPTTLAPYPTVPAGGNGTVPTQPSASASYPGGGYPTSSETPIATAGASKIGSGVAGVLAVVGVAAALF